MESKWDIKLMQERAQQDPQFAQQLRMAMEQGTDLFDPNINSANMLQSLWNSPSMKQWVQKKNAATAEAANKQSLSDRIMALYTRLSQAPGADDPVMRGLSGIAVDAAQQRGAQSGLYSPGAEAQMTSAAAQRLALPYLQQREGLAQQALGLANQRDIGLSQLQQQADELQYRADKDYFASQQQGGATAGSIGGAVLGGLGATALGFIPGIGPGLAMTAAPHLISGGANIGGGIGAQVGSGNVPRYRAPRYGGSY